MKKSKIYPLIFIFIFIIAISFCVYKYIDINKKPKITATIELKNISNKEYYNITETNKPSINDVKKLVIKINITNTKNSIVKEIKIPDLNAIDHLDKIRSYNAYDAYINNIHKDNFANSTKYIIFNSRGLTFDMIKKIYLDKNITVKIITQNNNKLIYTYNIGTSMIKTYK